jgi:SAM-dependent methyltransferase
MPIEPTPLFRAEVIRSRLAGFAVPADAAAHRALLARWVRLLESSHGKQLNEKELLPDFLTDVFAQILGYSGPAAQDSRGRYTMSREKHVEVDGKFADAVLGTFGGDSFRFVAAVEGKGPRDPLDRPYGGRAHSAVEQAYGYAINLPCDWVIVTNLREIRLYAKNATQRTFERFVVTELATDDWAFKRFVFLLGAERVIPVAGQPHLYTLLEDSTRAGEALTQEYYAEYARVRRTLLQVLLADNPTALPPRVLSATQLLLDRVLFIAFAEDRELLPGETLRKAYEHCDPYYPRGIWENFKALFRAIDVGSELLNIPRYNGGLFAHDSLLDDTLVVPDHACQHIRRLGDYSYALPSAADSLEPNSTPAPIVDVEILGHIFEQSVEDLEMLRAELDGDGATDRRVSKRRREGVFYTPKSITTFIVDDALRPTLAESFEALRREHAARAKGTQPAVLVNPVAYDRIAINEPQRQALIAFWSAWLECLTTIRVLDPACGSGAFLVEAFDQLQERYQDAIEHLVELTNQPSLFDPDRTILQHNLFGVDLNEEAVEICRLSIWIKTAKRGKVLAELNDNILVGNSVVADPAVDGRAFVWEASFSAARNQGGFDVVVGNPPYVRADHLARYKQHFAERYRVFQGSADLYVYFFEQGLRVLRPGGRLSFVVTNKWLKAEYAEPLRRYLVENAWLEHVTDLGHARQVFPDADVFPSIVLLRRPTKESDRRQPRAAVIPRERLVLSRVAEQSREYSFTVDQKTLTPEPWVLEPSTVRALMTKIGRGGVPLAEYLGSEPFRGVMTGYNDAFLLDVATRDALVAADPGTATLFKPYVRGQDIGRWVTDWDARWLLALQSSDNYPWPWHRADEDAETVFARTYPALYRHMQAHKQPLQKRSDQGRYWWELRSCSYYELFERPKLLYQEIQYYPAYALDTAGLYTNNKGFLLPTDDLYLLGLLNSPLMWWYNWRFLQHMKDDALTPAAIRFRDVPIAAPSDEVRETVHEAVSGLVVLSTEQRDLIGLLHDWLRIEFGIQSPGESLSNLADIDFDAFASEVKKRRTGRKGLGTNEVKHLREEFERILPALRDARARVVALESAVTGAVFDAYGLDAADVDLVWRTAPPRMPGNLDYNDNGS